MKIFNRVCISLAIFLIFIGGVLSIVGAAGGADLSSVGMNLGWRDLNFSKVEEDTSIEIAASEYEDSSKNNKSSKYYDQVRSLDMDIGFAKVIIKQGEEFGITTKNVDEDSFESYVEGDTWIIDTEDDWFSFGRNNHNINSLITVTLPSDFHGEYIEITLGAGAVEIDNLAGNTVDLEIGAGTLEAETLTIKDDGNISVGAGTLKVKSIFGNNLSVDTGAGTVKMAGVIVGDSDINCGAGKVVFDLEGNEEEYDYYIDSGIGKVQINEKSYHSADIEQEYNNGDNSFNVNCGIGTVDINIK